MLLVSSGAAGFTARPKPSVPKWNVKIEEGTEDVPPGTKMTVSANKKGIICQSQSAHGRHLVLIPASRVTQIARDTKYVSLASMTMGDDLGARIASSDNPYNSLAAVPIYGFLSLFEHQRRLVKITWLTKDNEESWIVLRVRKEDYTALLEKLESSTGLRSVDLWAEREKAIQAFWDKNPVPRDPLHVAGDKTLQRTLDSAMPSSVETASFKLEAAHGSAHAAAFEEKHTGVALCAVLAPTSEAYSVNCRLKDQEIPREVFASTSSARPLSAMHDGKEALRVRSVNLTGKLSQ
ncbi:MAG TPA: hypothetical protein VFM21_05885 [Terriglobia bacterium]|nr:hypothetical protein [Terriglobia bacterium]